MCGYVGFTNTIDNANIVLKKMMEKIRHRGPDGEGQYIDENVALGHRRLSIIDIDAGAQPMYNEDGSLVIVFNGEIYNYMELRKELINKGETPLAVYSPACDACSLYDVCRPKEFCGQISAKGWTRRQMEEEEP